MGMVYIVETTDNMASSRARGSKQVNQVVKLNGRQPGEYYGAALATADINGDGLDELIVGAPLHTHTEGSKSNLQGYEEGRISICTIDNNGNFKEKESIYGRGPPRSRYGSAVASLGDLDEDGFDDFVVGSPFEDDGKGAVRLYYGKSNILQIQGC
jgi:hypothetical protein